MVTIARVGLHIVEVIGQRVVRFGRLRLHVHAQSVFVLLVGEASPGIRILREDHRPLVLAGNHVQAVRSLVERLAFNRDRIGERDGRILVRARRATPARKARACPRSGGHSPAAGDS